MEPLKIYAYQAKDIENTLRLVSNVLNSKSKKTCLDRDIMQCWQTIKNIIDNQPDKQVYR